MTEPNRPLGAPFLRIATASAALALFLLGTAMPPELEAQSRIASSSALHIVVLEGEDAVNIVQQRTAVAPVVEVRDRNDQPVAGALVRFAIRSGRASFNGARALSVTTDTAGRAVASGLLPTGNGALQIGATATFQGQTAAVTIAQTNVMTAAQAAAASGAAGAGSGGGAAGAGGTAVGAGTGAAAGTSAGAGVAAGAAAAGAGAAAAGGLSATTIALAGAAVAGGTYAVTKVVAKNTGSGSTAATTYAGPFSSQYVVTAASLNGTTLCTYTDSNAGQLSLALTDNNVALTGIATLQAKWAIVTSACGAAQLGTFFDGTIDNVPVSGSAQNLSFTWQNNGTGANNVSVTHTYAFSGSLANGVVTGTLTYTYRGVNTGGVETASTQMPVTLH